MHNDRWGQRKQPSWGRSMVGRIPTKNGKATFDTLDQLLSSRLSNCATSDICCPFIWMDFHPFQSGPDHNLNVGTVVKKYDQLQLPTAQNFSLYYIIETNGGHFRGRAIVRGGNRYNMRPGVYVLDCMHSGDGPVYKRTTDHQ